MPDQILNLYHLRNSTEVKLGSAVIIDIAISTFMGEPKQATIWGQRSRRPIGQWGPSCILMLVRELLWYSKAYWHLYVVLDYGVAKAGGFVIVHGLRELSKLGAGPCHGIGFREVYLKKI